MKQLFVLLYISAYVLGFEISFNKEFTKQIQYAKKNNIRVFVYAIATKKGGVIKTQDGVQKDKNGNIVVTRLNENIKNLALDSDGAYLQYSTRSSDIKLFIDTIRDKFVSKDKKDVVIKNNEELFYIPIGLAIFAFLVSISGFRRR